MLLKYYSNGILIRKPKATLSRSGHNLSTDAKKRGKITIFSMSSARRLRKILLTKYVVGAYPVAVTLTTPIVMDSAAWRVLVHRYFEHFPYPLIWRVELQLRKVPHLHCILWADSPYMVCDTIRRWWVALDSFRVFTYRGMEHVGQTTALKGVFLHSAVASRFSTDAGFLRYMSCHTSKHKSSQLGWLGRQWGIINRSMFSDCLEGYDDISEGEYQVLCRWQRRLSRSRRVCNYTVVFGDCNTWRRWLAYLRSDRVQSFLGGISEFKGDNKKE